MALIIDAGNSRLKICSWECSGTVEELGVDQDIQNLTNLPLLPDLFSCDSPEYKHNNVELDLALKKILSNHSTEEIAMVSSVPAITSLIIQERPDVLVISHLIPLPFEHSITKIESVGPDRLCNMTAAAIFGLSNALVVDAGTATTFDLLLDGKFCGGLIAPGMAFSALKLGQEASLLKPVPFAPCPLKVGGNTVSAMAAGSFHVGVMGVQGVIQGLLSEYGQIPVVLTGGAGMYISHPGAIYDPHWTQRGAAVLAGFSTTT